MASKRRLRKDVEKARKERDALLGQVDEAVKKADRAQNALIEEYEQANGVLRGDEGGDADES